MYTEKIIGAIIRYLLTENVSVRDIVKVLKSTWNFKESTMAIRSTI